MTTHRVVIPLNATIRAEDIGDAIITLVYGDVRDGKTTIACADDYLKATSDRLNSYYDEIVDRVKKSLDRELPRLIQITNEKGKKEKK